MKSLNENTINILNLSKILKNFYNKNEFKNIILGFVVLKRLNLTLNYPKQEKNETTKYYTKNPNRKHDNRRPPSKDSNRRQTLRYQNIPMNQKT